MPIARKPIELKPTSAAKISAIGTGSEAHNEIGPELLEVAASPDDGRACRIARQCLAALGGQLQRLREQKMELDRWINAWHPLE